MTDEIRVGDTNQLIRHTNSLYRPKAEGPARAHVTADALSAGGVQDKIEVRLHEQSVEMAIAYVGPSPAVGDTVRIEWRGQPTAVGVIGGGAWTTYTPTWTASTPPAIENGTLTGAWRMVGRNTMDWRLELTFGSTSTAGSGSYSFGLPTDADAEGASANQLAHGRLLDSGTGTYLVETQPLSNANPNLFTVLVEGAEGLTHSSPMTWATGDTLILCGTFELA